MAAGRWVTYALRLCGRVPVVRGRAGRCGSTPPLTAAVVALIAGCSTPDGGRAVATTSGTATSAASGSGTPVPSAAGSSPAGTGTATGGSRRPVLTAVQGYTYMPDVLANVLLRLEERRDPVVARAQIRPYRIVGDDGWTARAAVMPVPAKVERTIPNRDLVTYVGQQVLGLDVEITALSSVNFAVTPPRGGRRTVAIVHAGGRLVVVVSEDREGRFRYVDHYLAIRA